MTAYILDPWTSYRHEIGIIRTSRTSRCAVGKKFSRKVTSGQITEQKYYTTNAVLCENFTYIYIFPFTSSFGYISKKC